MGLLYAKAKVPAKLTLLHFDHLFNFNIHYTWWEWSCVPNTRVRNMVGNTSLNSSLGVGHKKKLFLLYKLVPVHTDILETDT